MKFHFLRDFTKDETIEIICCESKDKVVDIFTKSLKLVLHVCSVATIVHPSRKNVKVCLANMGRQGILVSY